MKFLIFITLLFAGLGHTSSEKESIRTDMFLKDFYLICGSREGRFKSFEIGRSGNLKAKSGLFSSYKITRQGKYYSLNGIKYPEINENSNFKNVLMVNEKSFEEEKGRLKLIDTTKLASNGKIVSINYFIIDIDGLTFTRAKEILAEGKADMKNYNLRVINSGKCTKKSVF